MPSRRQRIDSTSSLVEQHRYAQTMDMPLPPAEYALDLFGQALWASLARTRVITDWLPADIILLAKACQLEDTLQEMDAVIKSEGFMQPRARGGAFGPHPLLSEVDRARRTQSAYLRTLRLHAVKTESMNNLGHAVAVTRAEHYAD